MVLLESDKTYCTALVAAIIITAAAVLPDRGSAADEEWCDFDGGNGSSSGDWLTPHDYDFNNISSQCIPLDEFNLREKVFDVCEPFMRNRCYMYDYGLDFKITIAQLNILNQALLTSIDDYILKECWDVIRAFVCNYFYIGCNPQSNLLQGICRDDCIDYLLNGSCAGSFAWLARFSEDTEGGFIFSLDCEDPLWYVKAQNPALADDSDDPGNCIAISDVVENPVINETPTESETESRGGDNTPVNVAIIISVVFILIVGAILIVLGLYIYRVRRQKEKITRSLMDSMGTKWRTALNYYGVSNRMNQPRGSMANQAYDPVGKFTLTAKDVSMLSEDLRNALIPFEQVKITGDLGEGAFGCVYKGILTKVTDSGTPDEVGVAIKTIKNHSAYHELKGFLKESSVMCSFSHPNVLGMEGICLDPESQSPYLILPFMKNGDLKTFLRKKRNNMNLIDVDYPEGLDHDTLLGMCYQIACGMEYLASRKLVHRDLAARNCMIDRDHTVKVADFGLTRDIYQKDYYRQNSKGQVPVKWMAPESLVDRISNEKTDVWSFGVTCWEVFSLGRVPYPTIANSEMVDYLIHGRRLAIPALCKDELFGVMLLCWKDDPDVRPLFENIVNMLESFLPESREYWQKHASGRLSTTSNDSYVFISDSSHNSHITNGQTVFTNTSFFDSNRCKLEDEGRERGLTPAYPTSLRLGPLSTSKHIPPIPSPLLHSTSYDVPHSIPRESFLQQNLSVGSAASVYLEMAAVSSPIRLQPLKELPDD